LTAQQQKAKEEAEAVAAEAARLAALQLEKDKKREAKLAAQRTDWVAGEECWAPISGKWVQVKVVRNVPAIGVTVELASGKNQMVEAKKLKTENPEASGGSTPEVTKKPAKANGTPSAKRGGGAPRATRGGSRGGGRGSRGRGQ
jgi:hypothetical protein